MQSFEEFLRDVQKYKLDTTSIQSLKTAFKYTNGCGSKGGIHFPPTMWGVHIEVACNLHDIRWSNAENMKDLLIANEQFDNDLKTICDTESMNDFTRWMRRMRIAKYVSGVELVGTDNEAVKRGFI